MISVLGSVGISYRVHTTCRLGGSKFSICLILKRTFDRDSPEQADIGRASTLLRVQRLCGEGHGNGSWRVDLLIMCFKIVVSLNLNAARVSVKVGGASDIGEIRFSMVVRIPYTHLLTDLYSVLIESNRLTFNKRTVAIRKDHETKSTRGLPLRVGCSVTRLRHLV